jgi:hypothetical protein
VDGPSKTEGKLIEKSKLLEIDKPTKSDRRQGLMRSRE